jgi:hypothetical protein
MIIKHQNLEAKSFPSFVEEYFRKRDMELNIQQKNLLDFLDNNNFAGIEKYNASGTTTILYLMAIWLSIYDAEGCGKHILFAYNRLTQKPKIDILCMLDEIEEAVYVEENDGIIITSVATGKQSKIEFCESNITYFARNATSIIIDDVFESYEAISEAISYNEIQSVCISYSNRSLYKVIKKILGANDIFRMKPYLDKRYLPKQLKWRNEYGRCYADKYNFTPNEALDLFELGYKPVYVNNEYRYNDIEAEEI